MALFILVAFIFYGWMEFEAFFWVGNQIGSLATFLGIFLTAFIGIGLLRSQTTLIMRQWQTGIGRGQFNGSTLAGGLSLLLGAFLMLLPGYITDFFGLICFTPGIRSLIGMTIVNRMSVSGFASSLRTRYAGPEGKEDSSSNDPLRSSCPLPSDEIIEGDFSERKGKE